MVFVSVSSSFPFLLFIGSCLFCANMEASNFDIDFSLAFHYNTSKPKASNVKSSMVFDYDKQSLLIQSKQHKPNVVEVHNLVGLRV